MKFWDSSALVPLCVIEPSSAQVHAVLASDRGMTVWWGTVVECESALARRRRQGSFPEASFRLWRVRLREIETAWYVVDPSAAVRDKAVRLLWVHGLTAADALQLSAALAWCEESPSGHEFVSLDERLVEAAALEGFAVLP